jgi:hypothetical protein
VEKKFEKNLNCVCPFHPNEPTFGHLFEMHNMAVLTGILQPS